MTGGDSTRGGGLDLLNFDPGLQGLGAAMAVRIINSTISGNTSAATAGAIRVAGNVALGLDNTTVSNNSAAANRTGGILLTTGRRRRYPRAMCDPPTLKLVSSIVANNSPGVDIATSTAVIPTLGINASNSLIQTICSTCAIVVSGPGNFIATDPMLGPLTSNGGSTRTHALLAGSPAIDTGSNPFGLTTDQRGAGFPRAFGGAADMGAYELSPAQTGLIHQYTFGGPGVIDSVGSVDGVLVNGATVSGGLLCSQRVRICPAR